MLTRQQLEDLRFRGNAVYGYKKAFCDAHSSCNGCDKIVRFWCKTINKIEKIQTKRILKICKESNHDT
jgi:hypothetical protein